MEAVQQIMSSDSYLSALGVTFKLSYRIKDKYQLFLKMQRKNLSSVSQVRDALGMRIIIEDYARIIGETDEEYIARGSNICYHLVNELRNVAGWVPAERGFKDYIKNSKENGYQSLHQYIKNKALGTNVEIQVRTKAMHNKASLGEAAHWFYKDKIYRPRLVDTKIYRQAWRSSSQTAADSPEALISMAKQQLLQSRVLVFLEDRSTVLNLAKGDTALDATFALHSDLGLTVSTIKISGKPVPLDYTLQNGDIVTCECSPGVMTVSPLWLEIAKSSSAIYEIRKYFRENNKHVLVCLGLVHLLMSITLSEERIAKRFPNGLPSVKKLSEFIKIRTPMSINNFADYLERLGGASLSDSASLIGSLLDIPMRDLKISSVSLGLFWARMENKKGISNRFLQKSLLLPILREVLPALDLPQIESVWIELIGSQSLHIEDDVEISVPLFQDSHFHPPLGTVETELNSLFSSKNTLKSTFPSLQQQYSTSPMQAMTYVNQHQNILSTKNSNEESTRLSEISVLTILTDVSTDFNVKPFQLHPDSLVSPGKYSSSGFYTRNTQENKKNVNSESQVYPTRRPATKKYSIDQTTAKVRSD